jgi:PilZ domain
MAEESPRLFQRRRCRGGVVVHRLGGGPSLKGTLADLGGGGARLRVDRPLGRGEVIRLVFPARRGEANRQGRMILGQVVHSRAEEGGYAVGVAFGWDAAVKDVARPDTRKAGFLSWLRSFWTQAAPGSRPR